MPINKEDLKTELSRLVDDYADDMEEMKGEGMPLQFDTVEEAASHFIKTCHDEMTA